MLNPFHIYARMLRIGARTKFHVKSTETVRNFVYISRNWRRQYGESTEPVRMLPKFPADSDGCSTVKVRTSRTEYEEYRRPAAEATRRPRRDYRESTEVVDGCGMSTHGVRAARTQYGCVVQTTDTVRTSAMFGSIYSLPI